MADQQPVLQTLVGVQAAVDGASPALRLGNLGDLLTNILGPQSELGRRGIAYHAQTAATGVAPGTAIGTTAAFCLANPSGSGKDVVVILAGMGYVSGTLGAGNIAWVAHDSPTQAAITGTAITPVCSRLGGSAPSAVAYTTATVPASGKPCRVFASLGASLASTATQPWQVVDEVMGAIVLRPGTAISLQGTTAAGSSPVVVFSVMWAEVTSL